MAYYISRIYLTEFPKILGYFCYAILRIQIFEEPPDPIEIRKRINCANEKLNKSHKNARIHFYHLNWES